MSGTNIKTVNNTSLLGSGNISVGGGPWVDGEGSHSGKTSTSSNASGQYSLCAGENSQAVGKYSTASGSHT